MLDENAMTITTVLNNVYIFNLYAVVKHIFNTGIKLCTQFLINAYICISNVAEEFYRLLGLLIAIKELPNIIRSLSLAFLTILIPLAIAIFSNIYHNQQNKNSRFATLDLHVIVDSVFRIKTVFWSILLIYLSSILLGTETDITIRLIALTSATLGLFFLGKTILRVYSWVKGNSMQFRVCYLRNLSHTKDMVTCWRSFWSTNNINPIYENQMFHIFSKKINKLLWNKASLGKKKVETGLGLLSDFNKQIKRRDYVFLIMVKGVFDTILDWHYKAWQKIDALYKGEYKEVLYEYNIVLSELKSIIDIITKKALNESQGLFLFYKLTRYSQKLSDKDEYLKSFLNIIFENIFREPEDETKYNNLWYREFPKEWKITTRNIELGMNAPKITFDYYIRWAFDRFQRTEVKRDCFLDTVTRNLFPKTDTIFLSRIIMFIFTGCNSKRLIEEPWKFGLVGQMHVYKNGQSAEEYEKEEHKNTVDLIHCLFNKYFSNDKLEDYMLKTEALSYPADSSENRKKEALLNTLKSLKQG